MRSRVGWMMSDLMNAPNPDTFRNSKQQRRILGLLKERGENPPYGGDRWVWMSTREIVMALRPDVEPYLAENRRYYRWVRRNMMDPSVHERYLEHLDKLKELPNYHTARTSINRSLRLLVKRGLVIRQPWWGMYPRQGVSAGWLLPDYMTDRIKARPEYLHLLKMAYDLEYRESHEVKDDV